MNKYERVINMLITRKSELCINGQHIVGTVQSLLLKLELS